MDTSIEKIKTWLQKHLTWDTSRTTWTEFLQDYGELTSDIMAVAIPVHTAAIYTHGSPNVLEGKNCFFLLRSNNPDLLNRNKIQAVKQGLTYKQVINWSNDSEHNPYLGKDDSQGAVATWLLGECGVGPLGGTLSGKFGSEFLKCICTYNFDWTCATLYIIPFPIDVNMVGPNGITTKKSFVSKIAHYPSTISLQDTPEALIQNSSVEIQQHLKTCNRNKDCDEDSIIGDLPHIRINFGYNVWSGGNKQLGLQLVPTTPQVIIGHVLANIEYEQQYNFVITHIRTQNLSTDKTQTLVDRATCIRDKTEMNSGAQITEPQRTKLYQCLVNKAMPSRPQACLSSGTVHRARQEEEVKKARKLAQAEETSTSSWITSSSAQTGKKGKSQEGGTNKSKKRKRKSNKTRKRRRKPSKQKKHKKSKKPRTKRNPNKRKTKRK